MHPLEVPIQRLANRMGLHITRVSRSASSDRTYEPVHPSATYCPWNLDAAFQSVHASIKAATLVDEYRCFELWQLVEQCSTLEGGSLLEVGVWHGGTGALIAAQAARCGVADRVYLCDTFAGVVKASEEDSAFRGGEYANTSRPMVEGLIAGTLGLENVEILEGVFPDETGQALADTRFRFCHIDVDTARSAKDVMEWVWDRVVPGGVIVYDDFGFKVCDGITRYVESQRSQADRLVIHNLNGHAIVVKR